MTGPTTLHDRVAEEAAHQAFIAQQEAAARLLLLKREAALPKAPTP